MPRQIYFQKEVEELTPKKYEPKGRVDQMALYAAYAMRRGFDWVTRYDPQSMTEAKWLNRDLFTQTLSSMSG